ncbi:polyphosphate kinase 1 [Fusobacterium sp.]|uniref:polyphosphate kinase 1 n=1 Tax=Fusobacterium sp. TaxID=68766 RepID=UPI0025BA7BC0|nr:polyphosphate kinase 1 [Fusobacterium sp.]
MIKPNYMENREISWLKFNERVLEEAISKDNPLLEQLKFLSIFTNNLDEFFMIRVGTMLDYLKYVPEYKDSRTGMTAQEQLEEIYKKVTKLYKIKDKIYKELMENLEKEGIKKEKISNLSKKEIDYLEKYFYENVYPFLSPLIIDTWHPFPFIPNKRLNIVLYLEVKKAEVLGIVSVPENIERIIMINKEEGRYILLEELILHFSKNIFSMYKIKESSVMRITRNMDIETDIENHEENIDYRQYMKQIIKKRNKLEPLRIELQSQIGEEFLNSLLKRLSLGKKQLFFSECPLDLNYFFSLNSILSQKKIMKLLYNPFSPVIHPLVEKRKSIVNYVDKKDLFLFYPFESMKPFLNLIKEASEREDIQSIKITLYRISKNSKIAEYLINAVENGKEVTVLMELRARFDESNNIEWAQKLEEAGCRVIYGIEGFKVHSKICLITYKKNRDIKYITQIGTGNYNEKTSMLYTDYSLITSNEDIGKDADNFFKNMSLGNLRGVYKKLWVAPSSFKQNILKNIDQEIEKVKAGRNGTVIIKCNSFTDKEIINKMVEASSLGVKITLIIRGICCLIPGITGKTENIKVISIVGRFLEHSRIYSFGELNEQIIYISSGDMMTRNTENRVEIGCPILDKEIKERINYHIGVILEDNQKSRILNSDGEYKKNISLSDKIINSQEEFITKAESTIYEVFDEEERVQRKSILKKIFHF